MIIVMETWHLKPGLDCRAAELMQEMDDMLGPPAHEHPGWCGHAKFYQSREMPTKVVMIYPWRSRELHDDLVAREEPVLESYYQRHCSAPRDIDIYDELAVEVEHVGQPETEGTLG